MQQEADGTRPVEPVTLKILVREVLYWRQKVAEAQDRVNLSHRQWEIDNDIDLASLRDNKETRDETEAKLRGHAMEGFLETGDLHPSPGVNIQERTVLSYDDLEAYGWAVRHEMCLTLDRRPFDAMAKAAAQAGCPLGIVTITKEPRATIATDLGAVLGAVAEDIQEVEANA